MDRSFGIIATWKEIISKHKMKPLEFTSVAGGVQKRLEDTSKRQKSRRQTVLDNLRNLPKCASPAKKGPQSKVDTRRMQLEKWKEEKEKKKKQEALKKKKPFLTGGPPKPLKYEPPPPPPKPMPSTSGRVTRSHTLRNTKPKNESITTQNKSFAPKNAKFKAPEIKNLTVLPTLAPITKNKREKKSKINLTFDPVLPKPSIKVNSFVNTKDKINKLSPNKISSEIRVTRSRVQFSSNSAKHKQQKAMQVSSGYDTEQSQTSSTSLTSTSSDSSLDKPPSHKPKTPRKSLQSESTVFTPKNRVPKSESSSEERLRSPKSPDKLPLTPEQIVEESKRISPCVTLSRGKANARKEMKQKIDEGLLDEDNSGTENVEHFRRQLASEVARLTELSDTWDQIQQQTTLPEFVQENVLAATGQARLLVAQKLRQFGTLVDRCARPEPGAALVTVADLRGFWDMVFMQVENVDMRFKKLEELKSRNWVEEQVVEEKRKVKVVKKTAKPAGSSRMREIIAAARKARKEQESNQMNNLQEPNVHSEQSDSKTFEAGFFCVRSPVRTPVAPSTPRINTLLKAVLSSEACKASASKNSASMAMLRASSIGKKIEDVNLETPIRLDPVKVYATPGRSILKSSGPSNRKSGKKSIKVVLFNDSDFDMQQDVSIAGGDNLNLDVDLDTERSVSSMENEEQNENKKTRRRSKIVRQEAVESPHVMTRSRRSMLDTTDKKSNCFSEEKHSRRSTRKKILQELDTNSEVEATPKRSTRRRNNTNQL